MPSAVSSCDAPGERGVHQLGGDVCHRAIGGTRGRHREVGRVDDSAVHEGGTGARLLELGKAALRHPAQLRQGNACLAPLHSHAFGAVSITQIKGHADLIRYERLVVLNPLGSSFDLSLSSSVVFFFTVALSAAAASGGPVRVMS